MNKLFSIILLITLIPVSGYSQEETVLSWDNLKPQGLEFENPYEDFEEDQLYGLSVIARVQMMTNEYPQRVTEKVKAEADSLRKVLNDQNIDVDGLLAMRYEVAEKRKKVEQAVVPDLDGEKVKMPGYLLALDLTKNASTEFLLVPWVGACIHTPPPPANQIVFVTMDEGFQNISRFEAVWVSGVMSTQNSVSQLYLVDGTDDIHSGYKIEAKSIDKYREVK